MRTPALLLRAFAVTAATLALAGCGETTVKTPTETAAELNAEETLAEGAAYLASQPSQVGGSITLAGNTDGASVQVTLLAIRDPARSTNQYIKPAAGKRYVGVRLRLKNTGGVVYDDSPSNGAALVDTQDQSFSGGFFDAVEPPLGSPKIRAGDQRAGWLTFEVPKASKLRTFQFSLDSGFGPETGEWALR